MCKSCENKKYIIVSIVIYDYIIENLIFHTYLRINMTDIANIFALTIYIYFVYILYIYINKYQIYKQ